MMQYFLRVPLEPDKILPTQLSAEQNSKSQNPHLIKVITVTHTVEK